MVVKRDRNRTLKEISSEENTIAKAEQTEAKLDYLAMMCGIDFPGEAEEAESEVTE